jgi:hypothetical protein
LFVQWRSASCVVHEGQCTQLILLCWCLSSDLEVDVIFVFSTSYNTPNVDNDGRSTGHTMVTASTAINRAKFFLLELQTNKKYFRILNRCTFDAKLKSTDTQQVTSWIKVYRLTIMMCSAVLTVVWGAVLSSKCRHSASMMISSQQRRSLLWNYKQIIRYISTLNASDISKPAGTGYFLNKSLQTYIFADQLLLRSWNFNVDISAASSSLHPWYHRHLRDRTVTCRSYIYLDKRQPLLILKILHNLGNG